MRLIFSILTLVCIISGASSQQIDRSIDIKQCVMNALIDRAQRAGAESVAVEIRSMPDIKLYQKKNTDIRISKESINATRGNCTIPLVIIIDGRTQNRLFVSARVQTFGHVFITKNWLDRNVLLSASDYETRWMETTSLPDDIVKEKKYLCLVQTSRIIKSESVITRHMLRTVPVIKEEDVVLLTVRSGRVTLTSTAVAKDAGMLGETITVQRTGTHERMKARITNAKTVEIVTNE